MRYHPKTMTAVALVPLFALTACGQAEAENGSDAADGQEQEDVHLRFAWWGSDHRVQQTEKIIEIFEEEYPHITIEGEYRDSGAHWDQIATQAAAQDLPDIIQMDDKYLREYADRDTLLELSGVDVSDFEDDVVDNGRTEDGLYGITTGINSQVLMANPRLFDEAGLDLPDDSTWTWDEFEEIALQITESVEDAWGMSDPNEPASFQVWLRQQGKHLTTEEGELGFDQADAQEYLQFYLDLMEAGAIPPADVISEVQAEPSDRSLTGTARAAMGPWWTNQLPGLWEASGDELVPLRWPSETGQVEDNGMWFKSSMFLSASGHTDHPEEVELFIDFFVNSEEAGLLNMVDRGLPANLTVRETVLGELDEADMLSAEIIEEMEDEISVPEPLPAVGFSAMQEILMRYQVEVFFENLTPEDAAEQMVAEMQAALD
ncbi:ABC transporter substrate-binding protein [Nesterenkonia alba]|uniref:ABC transporter substrate-binding protein n=1 Tax=Nesterenkonia alba TaxID=515814 RepID=UPI0004045EB5|nr:ABC transporter substrate-binding protein [Nesterenkonia alba]